MQRNFNQRAATWNKNQFIECNIMVQKYLAMVAILGAIAALSIGLVTTGQVKAFERTCHFWSNGDMQTRVQLGSMVLVFPFRNMIGLSEAKWEEKEMEIQKQEDQYSTHESKQRTLSKFMN
jgi:hypothetical protein